MLCSRKVFQTLDQSRYEPTIFASRPVFPQDVWAWGEPIRLNSNLLKKSPPNGPVMQYLWYFLAECFLTPTGTSVESFQPKHFSLDQRSAFQLPPFIIRDLNSCSLKWSQPRDNLLKRTCGNDPHESQEYIKWIRGYKITSTKRTLRLFDLGHSAYYVDSNIESWKRGGGQ